MSETLLLAPVELDHSDAERRLQAAYSEIAQLAGGLAHEVRNPLSIMRLNLDLLAEDFQDAESQRERRILQKIERVRKESVRLEDLLEDFLRLTRVQDLRLEPADLNSVVDDLRDFFEGQASSLGIVLRSQFDPDLPAVPLDVDLFKQALLNLLLNSQHAMPDGGELILTTRLDEESAVVEVVDTGIGMTPEVRSRIFDPFYSTRKGGTGLGLPTTYKVVAAHGGTIGVESEPGRGSKFTIKLPISDPVSAGRG